MKHSIYLAATVVLGILFQFLVHATLEIWYINLLLKDFSRYSFGFSWEVLRYIHHVLAIVLFVAGVYGGYRLGVQWWRIVYIERKHWLFKKQ